jgi:hypothetical protein
MSPFFVAIALNLVSAWLTRLTAPKPVKPKAGTLETPKATEGDEVVFVFGTMLIKSPTVAYSGNQRAIAVRKKGGKK